MAQLGMAQHGLDGSAGTARHGTAAMAWLG